MRPSMQRHNFDEQSSIQIISLTSFSHTLWGISTPARNLLLSRLRSGANLSLVVTTTMSRVRGFGAAINRVHQTWPLPDSQYEAFARAIEGLDAPNGTRPSLPLDCFYSPFLFNSPLSIQVWRSS